MNISIFSEMKGCEMRLQLEQDGSSVVLVGRDGNSYDYSIAEISDKGIQLIAGIPFETGWPLDKYGKLKLAK
jgi:hypothetical protein